MQLTKHLYPPPPSPRPPISPLVRKVRLDYLLSKGLRIPLFQRRYCWSKTQWRQLYSDAKSLATGRRSVHPLGRLTCVETEEGLVVIDGQQRNTTCIMLLAAVRDVALEVGCPNFAGSIDFILFQGKKEETGGRGLYQGLLDTHLLRQGEVRGTVERGGREGERKKRTRYSDFCSTLTNPLSRSPH